MPKVFLEQRERFRAATLTRLGIGNELFDQFNRTVAPYVQHVRFRKGEFLQCCTHPAVMAFWINGGVTRRGIFTRDGGDMSMGFAIEGEPCGSHHDLLAGQDGKPATEFVVAETPVSAARFEWTTLIRLREQHEFMREYYIKVAEYSLRRYTESCYMRSMTSAADRLLAFRELYPGLEQRISQKSLASFLGITPQYMSTLLRRAHSRAE
jgi:CRP-like cAMP-binding protein